MADEVGTAFVSVMPTTKGFGRAVEKGVGSDVKKSGSRIGTILGRGAVLGVAAAGVALTAFVGSSIKSLARIERINTQTAQVIKSTGGAAGVSAKHVENLAGSIENLTATEAETAQEGANLLLTFTSIRNGVGKNNQIFDRATTTAVDMSRALGQDMKSSAIQLGKALNDPVKGVSALQRVGVSFTEQQKEQIKTLVESGDTMGAQKLILAELGKEFGGAGEAFAKTTEGQIELAKHAFGTLGETLSAALLPPLGKLAGATADVLNGIAENAGPVLEKVGTYLAPFKDAIAGVFDSAGGGAGILASVKETFGGIRDAVVPVIEQVVPVVSSLFSTLLTTVVPVVQTIYDTFSTQLLPAITAVVDYVVANLVPIFVQVAGVVQQIIPVVGALATWLYGTLVPAVLSVVTSVAGSLKPVLDALVQVIQGTVLPAVQQIIAKFNEWRPTLQQVVLIVVKVVGWVLRLAAAILGKVLPPLIRFAGFLIRVVVKAVVFVIDVIVKVIGWLIRFGAAVGRAAQKVADFAGKVKTWLGKVFGWFKDLPGKVTSAVGDLGSLLSDAGRKLIEGLWNGIKNKWDEVKGKVGEIAGWIKDHFPFSPAKRGPLKAWHRNGGPGATLVRQLADGLEQTSPLDRAMRSLTSDLSLTGSTLAPAAATSGALGSSRTAVQLVVGDRVFDAYVRDTADARVSAARAHAATLGRQR